MPPKRETVLEEPLTPPTSPSGEIVSGQPTRTNVAEDERASFVTLKAAGKNHTIILKPTRETQLQVGGEKMPRWVADRQSGIKVRFVEGTFITDDPWIINELVYGDCGFGQDFDINRHDPTGYWRKNAEKYGLTFTTHQTFEVKGSPGTVKGAVNMAAAAGGAP